MTKQTTSEDISQLALALSQFQGTVPSVLKGKTANVGQYKYKYADLADIFNSISKTLMEYELAVVQFFTEEEGRSYIVTTLMHSSGQWVKSYLKVAHHEKIQQLGSEITYLRRYALSSLLGIAAEDDDDGAQANQSERKEAKEVPIHISKKQLEQLEEMLVQVVDTSYEENFCKFMAVKKISSITQDQFERAVRTISKKLKHESEPKNESAIA